MTYIRGLTVCSITRPQWVKRWIIQYFLFLLPQAQHQGIIAMLGALDDGSTPHGDARGLGGSREDRLSSAGQEYTVMSVHAVDETNPKSSVDVEVTPLPSDAFSLDEDDPLTMSDLGKGLAQPRAAGGALNGALRELRQMENLHIRDQKPPPEKQAQWGGKENQIPWHLSQQQQGEPFARVMATLRHINHNVLGVPQRPGAPTVPFLLHAPPTSSSTPLHLPIIPTTAPTPAPVYQSQVSSVAPAPLLYQPSPQQQVDQLPVRDHTSMPFFRPPPAAPQPQFAGFRMPLLQFHGRTAPVRYPHLEDHRGTPHLIPPNLVFPHGQPTEDIPKVMPSQEPLGARLLSGKPPQPPVPTFTAEVRNDGKRWDWGFISVSDKISCHKTSQSLEDKSFVFSAVWTFWNWQACWIQISISRFQDFTKHHAKTSYLYWNVQQGCQKAILRDYFKSGITSVHYQWSYISFVPIHL